MPGTRYASVGDAEVAYQVVGAGPRDLLYVFGLGSNVEMLWSLPGPGEFTRRLESFSRLVVFDRRGTGASDAVGRGAFPTWEEWAEDLGVVSDAVGSRRTAVWAHLDAGP